VTWRGPDSCRCSLPWPRPRVPGRSARGLDGRCGLVLLCAWLLLAGSAPAAAQARPGGAADGECRPLGQGHAAWHAPQAGDTLALPDRLVLPGSVRVTGGDSLFIAGRDYRLEPIEGWLVWRAASRPRVSPLQVFYRHLPLPLAGRWGRRVERAGDTLRVPARPPSARHALPPGARLEIGGSKTFSLEFGNRRDAKLSQSLDLTLRGTLAESVTVRAVLTDRSTPLQPEGTTTELRDLDQVLIEVDAPWGELRLGDIRVLQPGFRFLVPRREMDGLFVRAGAAAGRQAHAALGRDMGRLATVEFFGEEGKQGPYRLLAVQPGGAGARRPGEEAVLIAGSERVYLDGVRLTRGEEADYTIDYGTGELWFNPRHAIASVTEIRASYQLREGLYGRDYYALGGAVGDSTAGLALAWTRERDQPEQAAGDGLTDAERDSLRAAGDDALTLAAGAIPDSLGTYVLVEADTAATPFFLYVGEDPEAEYRQRYRVSFADVGATQGDYAARQGTAGETYYAYVGDGRGRYLPGRRVRAPEGRDLIALRAAWGRRDAVRLRAEAALSAYDRNLLSRRDDGDNAGGALAVGGEWAVGRLLGQTASRVTLAASGRSVGERFQPSEPLEAPFSYRRWNASSDTVLDGRDDRIDARLAVRPGAGLELAGGWERIDAGARFAGTAWEAEARRGGTYYGTLATRRVTSREQGRAGEALFDRVAVGRGGGVALELSYERERRLRGSGGGREGTAHRAYALQARVGSLVPGLTVGWSGELRRDRRWDDGRREADGERRLYQVDLGYNRGGAAGQLLYSRRERRPADGGAVQRSDLADWFFSYRGRETGASGEWRGRVTTAENRLRQEQLRYVGPEEGHYDSLGHYVGAGDYELYYETTDSTALETRIENLARFGWRPFRHVRRHFLQGLETNLFARLDLVSDRAAADLLQQPGRLWTGDADWRRYERQLRADLAWKPRGAWPAPRLRLERRLHRDRSAGSFARERRARDTALELRYAPGGAWRGLGAVSRGTEREGTVRDGAESFDERRRVQGALEASWSWRSGWALRARGERMQETLSPQERIRRHWTGTLGWTSAPWEGARIEVTYERRWIAGAAEERAGPFLLTRPGWEVTANGTLRPRGAVSGHLWIRVGRETGGRTVIDGRMEVRAYF